MAFNKKKTTNVVNNETTNQYDLDIDNSNIALQSAGSGYAVRGNANINVLDGGAFSFAESVNQSGVASSKNALNFADSALNRSLNTVDKSVLNSLDVAGYSVSEISRSADSALSFAGQTVRDGLNFAGDTVSTLERGYSDALGTVERSHETGLGYLSSILNTITGRVTESNADALESVNSAYRNYARDLGTFAESQSETNDTRLATVVKWMIGATVVTFAANAWLSSRKRAA